MVNIIYIYMHLETTKLTSLLVVSIEIEKKNLAELRIAVAYFECKERYQLVLLHRRKKIKLYIKEQRFPFSVEPI